MIRIEFSYDPSGNITGFKMNGHAGYDISGKDIVCSAVSVLALNTVNSIEEFCDDDYTISQDEEEGLLELYIDNDEISDSSALLLKSLRLGIESVIESYGDDYVNLVN